MNPPLLRVKYKKIDVSQERITHSRKLLSTNCTKGKGQHHSFFFLTSNKFKFVVTLSLSLSFSPTSCFSLFLLRQCRSTNRGSPSLHVPKRHGGLSSSSALRLTLQQLQPIVCNKRNPSVRGRHGRFRFLHRGSIGFFVHNIA